MEFEKIIVLDDELIIRKTLEEQLRKRRYQVASASTLAQAERLLEKDRFDLIFVDVRLPDGDGTQLLERFSGNPESPMIVVMTGFGSIESAVKCMKLGAFDYIIKPFSIDEIEILLDRANSYNQIVQVNQYFTKSEPQIKNEILGESKSMVELKHLIQKVGVTEATVLISGESGTGKELVAQELHRQSALVSQPYITVNCAAISENLIESEFFGHEKGAFTGALQRRIGRFELAHNGTILLDEISEISNHLQAKLLRVLQEKNFERVGGNKTIQVNTRVIATTNRNLMESVKKGEFREDLYYRLNVFPIEVPPLRSRKEDIPLLANNFLKRYSRKHGMKIQKISEDSMQILLEYNWPGNVRELQNTIERAVILTGNGSSVVQPNSLGISH